MKNLKALFVLPLALALCSLAFGQATTTSTTFSVAVGASDTTVNLTSATGVTAPVQGAFTWMLWADRELMGVQAISGTVANVVRGVDGTKVSSHTTSATVWEGPPGYFSQNNSEPSGSCYLPGTSVSEAVNQPRFFEVTGNGWTCPTSGPRAGQWTMQYAAPGLGSLSIDGSQYGAPSALKVCHAQYAVGTGLPDLGTASTTFTPTKNCVIPINSVLYMSFVVVTVAPTSSGGTFSIGLSAGGAGTAAILGATTKSGMSVGNIYQGVQVPASASAANTAYTKQSAAGSITFTNGTGALAVGTIDAYVYYVELPA